MACSDHNGVGIYGWEKNIRFTKCAFLELESWKSRGFRRWVLWVRYWVFVDLESGFHVDWRSVTICSSISSLVMLRCCILLFYFSLFVSVFQLLWVYAVFGLVISLFFLCYVCFPLLFALCRSENDELKELLGLTVEGKLRVRENLSWLVFGFELIGNGMRIGIAAHNFLLL